MLTLEPARAAALEAVEAMVAGVESATDADWALTVTPCEGWSFTDLAAHVLGALLIHTEAYERMLGQETRRVLRTLPDDRHVIVDRLVETRKLFGEALEALTEDVVKDGLWQHAQLAKMGIGVPGPLAVNLTVMEFGLHRTDVELSCGRPEVVADDTVTALLGAVPGVIQQAARGGQKAGTVPVPEAPMGYRIEAGATKLVFAFDEKWSLRGEPADPCVVKGSPLDIAMFLSGRRSADDARLEVSDLEAARKFKQFLPGP